MYVIHKGSLKIFFYFIEKQAFPSLFSPYQKIHIMIICINTVSQVREYYIRAQLGMACAGLSRWFTARFVEVSVACAGREGERLPVPQFCASPAENSAV
jgi:hypothetical protein